MPSPGHASADAPGRGSGAFLVACSAIGIALVALCAWLAREEYFFGDDFLFLRQAQLPRDWVHVFFPLGQRAWWSYRPLSIEVYFSALHAVAGIDAFPYLLASLAAHFGAGVVVFRLAGRLALDRRVAIVAGLLSVALYPALNAELFWASTFQTVSGTFFYALAVALFVGYLQSGLRRWQLAACAAMVAALLANELAMTLPGPIVLVALVLGRGGPGERVRAALHTTAPVLAILVIYLPFRYLLLGPSVFPTPVMNLPRLGWHVPRNVLVFLDMLLAQSVALEAVVAALVAAGWIAAARTGAHALSTLAQRVVLFGGWLLCTMVPYLGTYFVHHRAAIVMQAPFALLLCAHLDPIARAATSLRARRLVEAGLVALLLATIPYRALLEQARSPRGAVNRDLLALVGRGAPDLPAGGCVRIHARPGDVWTPSEVFALGFRTTGVLAVSYPGRHLELPAAGGGQPAWRDDCAALFDVEVLHGPAGSRPSFVLRPLARDRS